MVITLETLQQLKACKKQITLFQDTFGTSVTVNEANCLKALEVKLEVLWLVPLLLSDSAWAEYEKVRDSALAEYKKVRDSAWAEYEKVRDSALAEYEKVRTLKFCSLIS